jgi:deoxyxylulose-5-phosphate synthase
MPWANRLDETWWREILDAAPYLVVVENHLPAGGLGAHLLTRTALAGWSGRICHLAVVDVPRSGANDEILRAHGLDGPSIAASVVAGTTRTR